MEMHLLIDVVGNIPATFPSSMFAVKIWLVAYLNEVERNSLVLDRRGLESLDKSLCLEVYSGQVGLPQVESPMDA